MKREGEGVGSCHGTTLHLHHKHQPIMKTRIVLLTLFIIQLLSILSPISAQWPKYVIDNENINEAVTVDTADFNGDTKPDLVVTNLLGNQLIVYQNNFPYWSKYVIDNAGAEFAFTGDMNGDDTPDIVANLWYEKKIVWYENNHPSWTKHIIDAQTDNGGYIQIADFNNDDTLDVVVAASYGGGNVVWYENHHPDWIEHIIEEGNYEYGFINVNDFDEDGYLDVAGAMNLENKVVWFRNENEGLSWTKYTIDSNLTQSWSLSSYDFNGDSRVDIFASGLNTKAVWYENNYPSWTKHSIDPHGCAVVVEDIDGNDTLDLIGNKGYLVWYDFRDQEWTEHIIGKNVNTPKVFALSDIDGDNIKDMIVPCDNEVIWFKNPFTTAAYTDSMKIDPFYIQSPDDTLKTKARLHNPENHEVRLMAQIKGEQFTYSDSLQLYDDGLHYDGDSSDNIWGNIKLLAGVPEDYYLIDLIANDLSTGTEHYYHEPPRIVNFGPVSIVDWSFTGDDTEPNPGDQLNFKVSLKNNGLSATATNITTQLTTEDDLVYLTYQHHDFDDIPASESATSTSTFLIRIYDEHPIGSEVPIVAYIFSDGFVFWTDSFLIPILEPDIVNTTLRSQIRIHPNPAGYQLHIEFNGAIQPKTSIRLFDITGKVVFEGLPDGTTEVKYSIDFSDYEKGLYLINISNDHYSFTKKVIKAE